MGFVKEPDAVRHSNMWFRRSEWVLGSHIVRLSQSMCKEKLIVRSDGERSDEEFALVTAHRFSMEKLIQMGSPGQWLLQSITWTKARCQRHNRPSLLHILI